jgi:hypothetical protein
MKWVREKAQEVFRPQEITDDPNPEYVVAHGTALYAKAQYKALQQLLKELRYLDYESMYKTADSEATQIATKKMLPTVINELKGSINYTGIDMRQKFCDFFYGLNRKNNEYCKILQECMNNRLSEKIRKVVGEAIQTVFNCTVDTSDIKVEIPITVYYWNVWFYERGGDGHRVISTAIDNASGRFDFTWDKPRLYDERKKIADSCLSTFSTRDPFGTVGYEELEKFSKEICDETLKQAKEIFHKKELFKTTFKRS